MPNKTTLQYFSRRLSNLSGANRLLFLPRLRIGQEIDFVQTDWTLPQSAATLRNAIVNGTKHQFLTAVADPRDADGNLLSRALHKLKRQDQFIQQEQGTQDLHWGYPFVVGRLADGVEINAPLVLFPCVLEDTQQKWQLSFSEAPYINPSFLLAWSHYSNAPLPTTLIDEDLNYSPLKAEDDHVGFITYVVELLASHKIDIRITSEIMDNPLKAFVPHSRSDLAANYGIGQLELKPNAILCLLQQPDGFLQADYTTFLEEDKTIESIFLGNNSSIIREADTYFPLSTDGSQWRALLAIRQGQSLVIQGPPGSGKSQLITNLIADFISRGKTVALVCQKRVALDVVHQRLSALGVAPWVALVHDYKEGRRQLYQQLKAQVDAVEQYQQELNTTSALGLEQEYATICREIVLLLAPLQQAKDLLYAPLAAGLTPKLLMQYQMSVKEGANYQFDWAFLVNEYQFEALQHWNAGKVNLKLLLGYYHQLDGYGVLKLYKLFYKTTPKPVWDNDVVNWLDELIDQLPKLKEAISVFGGVSAMHPSMQIYHDWELNAEKAITLGIKDGPFHIVEDKNFVIKTKSRYLEIFNEANDLSVFFKVPEDALSELKSDIEAIEQKKASFFGKLIWTFDARLNAIEKQLPGLSYNIRTSAGFDTLVLEFTRYQRFKADIYLTWPQIKDIQNRGILLFISQQVDWITEIEQLSEQWPINKFLTYRTSIDQAKQYYAAYQCWSNAALAAQPYMGTLLEEFVTKQNSEQVLAAIRTNHSLIISFDAFLARQPKWMTDLFYLLNEPIANPDRWLLGLEASLLNTLSAKMFTERPLLAKLGSWEMENQEQILQDLLLKKQALAKALILLRLKETTSLGLEYNRLQNRTTYRNLSEQLIKKRQLWPLRKLYSQFRAELMRLAPCWLLSPESMAAIVELQSEPIFDLVIVDEASQCYAERGLPALARGKQVVVVGDKMQLQPYNLYQIRYEVSEDIIDQAPDLDSLSLLDLASRYTQTQMMTGHYRSQTKALIAFSNTHFYDGKLQFLEPPVGQEEPAIVYHHIPEGLWEKQSNLPEAEAVVDLLIGLLDQPSVGVITFNIHQQTLIYDLLSAELIGQGKAIPENWFIKSLEHVQGDEAEIIVFSVAYGPDKAGKIKANYGSLSQAGGENRLNVGITRARKRLIVFSSLMPHQLPTDNSTNLGPRLLKSWLHYVAQVAGGATRPNEMQYPMPEEVSLAGNLLSKNPEWTSLLPLADLRNETTLYLTDDERFRQQLDARAEFGFLPMTLKAKGYQYKRFWLNSSLK